MSIPFEKVYLKIIPSEVRVKLIMKLIELIDV